MSSFFKYKTTSILTLSSGVSLVALSLIAGCGGGGGGSSTPSGTPSPFDFNAYDTTYNPTDALPSDGTAPTGTFGITNGRGNGKFTFYLQPKVITGYQPQIDKALTDRGYGSDIRNNQIPSSITFSFAKNLDGSGKAVFTSSQNVKVCGTGVLTVDSTFLASGGGNGTYKLTFPNKFRISIRGKGYDIAVGNGLGCNNLPLRSGTASFTRSTPTATPVPSGTPAAG